MKQLSMSKKKKLVLALKKYRKKFLNGKYPDVNEATTREMVSEFLAEVLGFLKIKEIKPEYEIKHTYADYVIQINSKIHFVVEVKAMPIGLSEKHLRQTVNYAANEGIDWALLTNGKQFHFYKIVFSKPIESRKVFQLDLSDEDKVRQSADSLQYLTRPLVLKRGLDYLWNKVSALEPANFARLLYSDQIINNVKRQLKRICKNKFSNDDVKAAMTRVVVEEVESIKPIKHWKGKKQKAKRLNSVGVAIASNASKPSGV